MNLNQPPLHYQGCRGRMLLPPRRIPRCLQLTFNSVNAIPFRTPGLGFPRLNCLQQGCLIHLLGHYFKGYNPCGLSLWRLPPRYLVAKAGAESNVFEYFIIRPSAYCLAAHMAASFTGRIGEWSWPILLSVYSKFFKEHWNYTTVPVSVN